MKTLYTKRLIIRDFTMDDLTDFNQYCSVQGVGEMAGWSTHKSLDESKEILSRFVKEGHTYCLELKQTGKVIGSIGIEERNNEISQNLQQDGVCGKVVEIGYVLAKDHWNCGLMTEAVTAVVESCFCDLHVDHVMVGHFPFNVASKRVIEKTGFKYIKTLKNIYPIYDGQKLDVCLYSQSAFDFFQPRLAHFDKAVALVGMCGSGKSVLTEMFEQLGWSKVYFGGVTVSQLKKEGLEINEANERAMREGLRKKYGMGAFAVLLVDEIKEKLAQGSLVLDGLYSWSEFTHLEKALDGKILLCAVVTNRGLRYQRLASRTFRPLTNQQATSRDFSEIENLEKGGPIACADYYVDNNGTYDDFRHNFYGFLAYLLKN